MALQYRSIWKYIYILSFLNSNSKNEILVSIEEIIHLLKLNKFKIKRCYQTEFTEIYFFTKIKNYFGWNGKSKKRSEWKFANGFWTPLDFENKIKGTLIEFSNVGK